MSRSGFAAHCTDAPPPLRTAVSPFTREGARASIIIVATFAFVFSVISSKLIVSGEDSSELGSVETISPIPLSFSERAPSSRSKVSKEKRASTR